ncbi:MAG: 4-hydroxy-tetrahydrodipicolinate reductase [Candidatus Liberibacter ctenarytainae]|uniref:4-hydroxy-tetrahydrodipicolinate reductase n=1 Tax=Candidatus Liberibacter ctenarytainae TaxID=2020335 RepID=A0A937DLG4_9HYPH|nr:4-hydroxy-tetrahydrodipicolinate reductase [Candidatus Liberibacter ctenarytainae]
MQKPSMKIAILGGGGRMGGALIKAIHTDPSVTLKAVIVRKGSSLVGKDVGIFVGMSSIGVTFSDDISQAMHFIDGIIDFSSPEYTLESLGLSYKMGLVHIIGTTGFSDEENESILSFARSVRIVKSGNMSLGINFMGCLVKMAAGYFPSKHWDFEILEMHHRRKVDAPSGTALLLGEAVARGRHVNLSENSVLNRHQESDIRREGSIGFATLRGGSIVGEHSVLIAGEGESLTLSHSAYDRSIFARGAIAAAMWAASKGAGLYSMQDVLGFQDSGFGTNEQ